MTSSAGTTRTIYQSLYDEEPTTVEHLGALGVLSARLGRGSLARHGYGRPGSRR